jgi:hypothetical protein
MIPVSKAEVIPAIPERTYDRWAIENITIEGDGIVKPVRVFVRFVLCRVLPNGIWERHPENKMSQMEIPDLYAFLQTRESLPPVMAALTKEIVSIASEQGLL